MGNAYKQYIPREILEKMLVLYRSGSSPVKLQAMFGYSYSTIVARLKKHEFNIGDKIEKGMRNIKEVEETLVSGTFPDYKFEYKIKGIEDYDRYKRVLNYYAKADLNNKFY